MSADPVYVLGGAQTHFARNWHREGLGIQDMMAAAVHDGLQSARLDATDVDVAHIGNFVGELFAGQGLLGGFLPHIDPAFDGLPTVRHEAACASGSMAVLAAMADLQSGRFGLACVLGVEMMRNVPGKTATDYLGAAAWHGREAVDARYVWPAIFDGLAEEYHRRYGLDWQHLAEISRLNFANARRNPNAQTANWTFTDASFSQDDEANPVIDGWIRRSDCGQVTDGAATVFLATRDVATAYARRNGLALADLPRIKGWGWRTAPLEFATKMSNSRDQEYVFPQTRQAILDAYGRAGIQGPEQIDGFETHDCFSITEYMAIEHFGVTPAGQAWRAVEAGRIAPGGDAPFNPSGGLIGCGHPVGATGVRMVLDCFKQTTGTAGDYQVEAAKNFATFNVGGSGTANVSFVVGVD